jgi:uncharacterized membrane protein
MDFLNALLQPVAAFLIFAAAYLVLLLSVVICFVIAICLWRVGSLAWAYTVRFTSLDRGVIPQIESYSDSGSRLHGVQR